MSGPYFIEVLARNGDVLHRHQCAALPIRLGRGYDNDFIVDDAHAAARHAIIEHDAEGRIVMRDLGSRNGVIERGKRRAALVLGGDTVVRIGHTSLRVRPFDFPVAPELIDRTMHGWEGALPALAGLLLIALFALDTTWIGDTQPFQAIRYVQALATWLGAGLLWGGVWAFTNRLFGRHARMGRHLFIFGCGLTAISVVKALGSLCAYAFSLEALSRYGSHAVIAIVCAMLFYHLCMVKPHHPKRFAAACMALLALASGLVLMGNDQRSGHLADDPYMAVLLPPSVRVSRDHEVDEFLGDVAGLKAKLDQERAHKVKDDGGDGDDD
ncbi:MAG: FHA domain-containing protein [Pseudomonadota bacterium]